MWAKVVQTTNQCFHLAAFGGVVLEMWTRFPCFRKEENVKDGNLRLAGDLQSVVLAFVSPRRAVELGTILSQLAACFPRRSPCGFCNPTVWNVCVCARPFRHIILRLQNESPGHKVKYWSTLRVFHFAFLDHGDLDSKSLWNFQPIGCDGKAVFFLFSSLRPIYREYLSHYYSPAAFRQRIFMIRLRLEAESLGQDARGGAQRDQAAVRCRLKQWEHREARLSFATALEGAKESHQLFVGDHSGGRREGGTWQLRLRIGEGLAVQNPTPLLQRQRVFGRHSVVQCCYG